MGTSWEAPGAPVKRKPEEPGQQDGAAVRLRLAFKWGQEPSETRCQTRCQMGGQLEGQPETRCQF